MHCPFCGFKRLKIYFHIFKWCRFPFTQLKLFSCFSDSKHCALSNHGTDLVNSMEAILQSTPGISGYVFSRHSIHQHYRQKWSNGIWTQIYAASQWQGRALCYGRTEDRQQQQRWRHDFGKTYNYQDHDHHQSTTTGTGTMTTALTKRRLTSQNY